MRFCWAILVLPIVAGLGVDQGVLSAAPERGLDDKAVERDSFEIFNEVNGLLRQWGNAIRPNGFSVMLASVPANTLLYHARTDSDEPSSPEWFAFDPEMSYGIYGGRRNTSIYIRTYRTTATLGPLLYFNGLSAALTFSGTLDSQDLLAPPSNPSNGPNVFGDYARAERLCAWASTRGISGFVRTNAGFELLWCDMNSRGLKLVRNMDVTQWADDMDDHSDRRGSDKDGEHGGGRHRGPPPPPGELPRFPGPGRGHPPGRGFNMFAQYASWEWLRAASHTYDGQGEARVTLHSGWHATARGIQDEASSELGLPTRMASLSNETIAAWRRDVDNMLRMAVETQSANTAVDWRGVTDLLVSQYSDRLPQLKNLLDRAFADSISEAPGSSITHAYTPSTNTSVHLQHAYRLVSSLILPFFERGASRDTQIDTCRRSIVPELEYYGERDLVAPYERKLWMAITHVHQSICTILIDIHSELTALRKGQSFHMTNIETSASQVQKLIAQLDWSSWIRCPDVCAWGQVCYIPIWPLFGFGAQNRTWWPMPGDSRPEPQCAGSIGVIE